MDRKLRQTALRSVMWDNSLLVQDLEKLLDGEADKIGHITRNMLVTRMLTGLPWFTVIQILPVEEIKELLTDELIKSLWPKSVQDQYKYVRNRLQEIIPNTR